MIFCVAAKINMNFLFIGMELNRLIVEEMKDNLVAAKWTHKKFTES